MSEWRPEQELDVLLDALTAELLAASDVDLAEWSRAAGRPPQVAAREMRRRVAAADADPGVPALPPSVARALGLLSRPQ
jgi:hypothetical protein